MRERFTLIVIALVLSLTGCIRWPEPSIEGRIERVERGLIRVWGDPPWKRMRLVDRMAHYNVPGVSIAVINDFQVEWAKGYGVLRAGGSASVTPDTRFQAASVGKLVVAVAALNHVERGLLELDGDVNRSLVSWQIPENALTAEEKVTLRRLLSHSAGVTVPGFRGYAQGEAVPNLQQILDGEPPANNPPIRVDTVPGAAYRYSGGGYMIVQQLLEDVTGRPFAEIMQDTVLKPWGMTASTFESPLPKELWAVAAAGHHADGAVIPGGWHTYPEMGAGASLWTTPSDLAHFVIGVMQAYSGRPDDVLSHEMAVQMLSPQVEARGLGPFLGDDGGDRFYFKHPGENEGYWSVLVAYPKKGQGVVIMTNGDSGEALLDEILKTVSVAYGWVRDDTNLYVSITAVVLLAFVSILLVRRNRAKGRMSRIDHEAVQ